VQTRGTIPLVITINQNDTFSFAYASRNISGTAALGLVDGVLHDLNSIEPFHTGIHFQKNGSVKGEMQESSLQPLNYLRLGKFKAKKVLQ
jgi:hypothetical protein